MESYPPKETSSISLGRPVGGFEGRRQRSARRLRHEAEIAVFKEKIGDLEGIRKSLGLRPTEIAELLRVHPSAWTRWTRLGHPVPPHIYRMLEWYLELQKWRTHNSLALPPGTAQIPEFGKGRGEALMAKSFDGEMNPSKETSQRTPFPKWLWLLLMLQFFNLGLWFSKAWK